MPRGKFRRPTDLKTIPSRAAPNESFLKTRLAPFNFFIRFFIKFKLLFKDFKCKVSNRLGVFSHPH